MARKNAGDVRNVATYCYQCVAGPDLYTVRVENGVATEVEPNFEAAKVHPAGGRICVKAYGLVQKTYNTNRITTPPLAPRTIAWPTYLHRRRCWGRNRRGGRCNSWCF